MSNGLEQSKVVPLFQSPKFRLIKFLTSQYSGQNNLRKPDVCCFIEDLKDERQLVCTIDHHCIIVFDPFDDKLIYEVPRKNQPGMRLTGVFGYFLWS